MELGHLLQVKCKNATYQSYLHNNYPFRSQIPLNALRILIFCSSMYQYPPILDCFRKSSSLCFFQLSIVMLEQRFLQIKRFQWLKICDFTKWNFEFLNFFNKHLIIVRRISLYQAWA